MARSWNYFSPAVRVALSSSRRMATHLEMMIHNNIMVRSAGGAYG